MDEDIKIFAQRANFSRHIEIGIMTADGKSVAQPLTMVPHDAHMYTQPAFRLPHDAAQNLIDDLWRMGFRPSDGTGNAGQLAATQAHLNDMRALAFKKLAVDIPK